MKAKKFISVYYTENKAKKGKDVVITKHLGIAGKRHYVTKAYKDLRFGQAVKLTPTGKATSLT
jgi:hypothetical protein